MDKYYIAYGSNLSVDQMKARCPDARPIGTAVLHGWRLVFRYHATIERQADKEVPVVIWAISPRDERNLDRYEGFPAYYHKKTLPVKVRLFSGGHETIDAMVYIMNGIRQIEMPSVPYHDVIEEGYRHFGFDRAILYEALKHTHYAQTLHEAIV